MVKRCALKGRQEEEEGGAGPWRSRAGGAGGPCSSKEEEGLLLPPSSRAFSKVERRFIQAKAVNEVDSEREEEENRGHK